MAPKKTSHPTTPATAGSSNQGFSLASLVQDNKLWKNYWKTTSHQTQLIDAFLLFLMLVGGIQTLYFALVSRDPFNAFLAGFIATVGQFVLTVSLRMQTDEQNKSQFPKTTPERSFADYVFCSLILHLFCVNYIN